MISIYDLRLAITASALHLRRERYFRSGFPVTRHSSLVTGMIAPTIAGAIQKRLMQVDVRVRVLVVTPLVLVFYHLVRAGLELDQLGVFHPIAQAGRRNRRRHGQRHRRHARFCSAMAALIGVPVGVLGGVFLSEYGGSRLNWWIRFAADILNGVPSITWGMVVYALVVVPMHGFSALAGGVVLGLMMIPLVMRTTEEVLQLVPGGYREAALALGIAKWRTIVQIVVRTALKGIVTGVLLALARVAGETAPLLFTAFGNLVWNHNLTEPIAAMPLQIFNYAISPYDDWHRQAWAGALVLLAVRAGHQRQCALPDPRPVSDATDVLMSTRNIMLATDPATASPRRPPAMPPEAVAPRALTSRASLSVFFGNKQVLKSVTLDIAARGRHRHHRPERLRQIHLPARAQPDARFGARGAHGRRNPVVRRGHLRARTSNRSWSAAASAWCSRNPIRFPTMSIAENVTVGLRLNGVRNRQCSPNAPNNRCAWRRCGTR